jgi:hypothetical protein
VTCGDTTTDPKSAEHIETTLAADVVVTPETPLAAKCIEDSSQATSPSKAIAMATTVGVAVLETLLTVEAVPPATDEGVEDVVAPALSPSPALLLVSPRTCFITNVTKPVEVTRGHQQLKEERKFCQQLLPQGAQATASTVCRIWASRIPRIQHPVKASNATLECSTNHFVTSM